MKKLFKLLLSRVVLVGAAIVVQAALLVLFILRFDNYFLYFYAFCALLSMCVVLFIVNGRSNPGYKIAWIIPILLFPVFGGLFYLMFGGNRLTKREKKKMHVIADMVIKHRPVENPVMPLLRTQNEDAANQARYIERYAACPVHVNTQTEYLTPGEKMFERLLEELKKAEHYIFMEYFILQEGKMWNAVLEVLIEKAQQGVDVRVMYDDMGCIMTLPFGYDHKLRTAGIQCRVFNPFIPVLSSRFNNRDHRKITVIDGHTGFTGGINLADEYINAYEKHGHWKDASILLHGEAVWNLTLMFLSMWDYIGHDTEDYDDYRPGRYLAKPVCSNGYVQPYSDSPLDDETVGENVYLNLINKAKRYVYITSPYLIIDNEMVTALCNAAKQGVDVRIITPHHADKWYVHAVTRAYYSTLVESGVKIYEYTPGFIHAKTYVVDDEYGVVGTINMDYRSLYLHFECAVWMYKTDCLAAMKEDYLKTLKICQIVTAEECHNIPWYRKIGRAVLRAFAPLM